MPGLAPGQHGFGAILPRFVATAWIGLGGVISLSLPITHYEAYHETS
jgi:hypothetical protein